MASEARSADAVVDHHRTDQHDAEKHLKPVGIDAGDHDALLHHAEDQCAEDGAERGAVAAGEQRPADHGGDDGPELLLLAAQCVGAGEAHRLDHRDESLQPSR